MAHANNSHMPKRRCVHCSEPFEGPEFWNYIFSKSTRELQCIQCDEISFLVQDDHISKTAFMLTGIGVILCLLPAIIGIGWVFAFLLEYVDVLFLWAPIGASILSVALMGLCLKLYRWGTYKTQADTFELKMDFNS